MKFLVAIAFIAVVGLAHAALTDEQKTKLAAYKKECVELNAGLDVALIEKAKQGEFTDDEKFTSFLKCLGEKLGFINADGSFNTPVIKEKLAGKVGGDVNSVVDKCVADDKKDGAVNAKHLAECLKKNAPAHEGIF